MKTTNPSVRNSVSHSLLLITAHCSLITVLLPALACFALSPAPNAFGVSPAPDGAYPGATTAEGQNALQSLTTGIHNTAVGYQTLFSNTTGHDNVATGFLALFKNTTGSDNTANGSQALYKNTTGNNNTADGFRALYSNTAGFENTANGYEALAFNTTGFDNTANGSKALYNNTTGYVNTANGSQALYKNTTGFQNTANGYTALYSNTTGFGNTANGYVALYSNIAGSENTANGWEALEANTTGGSNTANGYGALLLNTAGSSNTANGDRALLSNTTGHDNIALGYAAGYNLTTGDYNIDIGNRGVAGESGVIRIGDSSFQSATFIAGIYGVDEGGTMSAVYINGNNGQLGTQPPPSSRRFKKQIKAMDQTSQAILALKPVTFQYKSDPIGRAQFGLIAEEVAEVNPDLVVRDENGEIYTVRYEAVNAMLLNEFLKEHGTVQELKSTAAKQEATIARQQKQIEALTTGLQKVSDQLELSSPRRAPRTVVNNR
jgi:hypothetical protein